MVQRLSAGRVTADFFAGSYRYSASVIVYKRRLIDVLTDRTTDYLEMVDLYVSRINTPGDIVATYPKGSLVKSAIDFIVLPTETEGISKERFYGNRTNLPLFLSVPSFEIMGKVQWGQSELNLKKLLAADTQKFIPILEVTATNSMVPKVTFTGPMALVNKSRIQIMCPGS